MSSEPTDPLNQPLAPSEASPEEVSPDAPADPRVPGASEPAATGSPAAGSPAAGSPATRRRGNTLVVALSLVAVLAGGALFLSGWTLGHQAAMTPGTPNGEAEAFQAFWDTYRAVTDRYAGGEVDRRKVIQGAIKGMIGALDDPYSMYMTSEEFKASLQGISGEFEGIGATIGTVDAKGDNSTCDTLGVDCRLAVVAPIPGSPADKAGLLAGDVISKIDGISLDGLKVDEARSKIRGPKDSVVTLTIIRGGGAPLEVPITRAVIVNPEVETKTLGDGTVGYIAPSGFSEHAADEVTAALA